MKRYTTAAVILLVASALLIGGILKSFEGAGRAAAALAQAQADVAGARAALQSTQRAADLAKKKSVPAERFLRTWTHELSTEANIEQVFGQLDTLAVNNLLSPSGKNFAVSPNYFFNGRHMAVQSVNITVAGDYYRTLNWLGAAEFAFPLARVEQISYTTNANSLSLAVQFVFPRRFESE